MLSNDTFHLEIGVVKRHDMLFLFNSINNIEHKAPYRLISQKYFSGPKTFWQFTIVISISRNGHLNSCARFIIERSYIRKKQHDFKCVHFEFRMVLFSIECRKNKYRHVWIQISEAVRTYHLRNYLLCRRNPLNPLEYILLTKVLWFTRGYKCSQF